MIRALTAAGVVGALVGILGGCEQQRPPATVWSNVAETAFLVERYNHQTDSAFQFRYVENLTEALTQERAEADVVIGRWVNTPSVNALMEDADGYVSALDIADDAGPMTLLPLSPQWIPLSFNLQAIVFLPDRTPTMKPFSVALSDVELLYDEEDTTIHFAPTADATTMYALHRSLGFLPTADQTGAPRWDAGALEGAMDRIRTWQEEWNGGMTAEQTFVERYLYESPLRLLDKGRVSVVNLPSNALLSWEFFDARRYRFRWLADDEGTLTANEDVVYAGIPSAAERRTDAIRFLSWLTATDNQVSVLEDKLSARVDGFGILDGFSTNAEVNRRMVERLYPELRGRIPRPQMVRFSGVLPRYWNEARTAVVEPYLRNLQDPDRLADALALWYRQRGD